MARTLLAIAVSLVVGYVAAGFMSGQDDVAAPQQSVNSPIAAPSFDPQAPVEDRVRALEQAIGDERYARQVLQEEVWYLSEELLRLSAVAAPDATGDEAADATVDSDRASRREEYRRRNTIEGRIERLVEAGFLPSQASMIVQRESELQMDAIKARYEAERTGNPADYWRNRNAGYDVLRQELGDADYERYLQASGRSTNVTVSSVIESSPAQSAGLLPGDEILRYDGERVFGMTDLMQQTLDGTAGENVVVDFERDGIAMQVVMPRGPVGISGGRRRR